MVLLVTPFVFPAMTSQFVFKISIITMYMPWICSHGLNYNSTDPQSDCFKLWTKKPFRIQDSRKNGQFCSAKINSDIAHCCCYIGRRRIADNNQCWGETSFFIYLQWPFLSSLFSPVTGWRQKTLTQVRQEQRLWQSSLSCERRLSQLWKKSRKSRWVQLWVTKPHKIT